MEPASQYLSDQFRPEDKLAVVLIHALAGVVQRFSTVGQIVEPGYQGWLRSQSEHQWNIYATPNVLKPSSTGRMKGDIDRITSLYADIDRDGPANLKAAYSDHSHVPRPNFAVRTSPDHYQLIWQVQGFSQDQAERYLRWIVDYLPGADPAATDRNRVLRLPGFVNWKPSAHGHTVDYKRTSDVIYKPSDFRVRTDIEMSHAWGRKTVGEPGIGTPSHLDWAQGNRMLENGKSPSVVESYLRSTAGRKPNPSYYARHTLEKMLAYQERKKSSAGFER